MGLVSLALAISHTPWVPARVSSFARLCSELGITAMGAPTTNEAADAFAHWHVEAERAPNWVWSERMWRWAAETRASHAVFLQDDLRVCPNFGLATRAMLHAVPDQIISLYNGHPGTKEVAREGGRWCTTADGLVGQGYILPTTLLREFLRWRRDALNPRAVEHITEDTLIDVWAVATGRKVWHPVPTTIDHDLEINSTYGNDGHPYRKPAVTWNDGDICDWTDSDLTSAAFWSPHHGYDDHPLPAPPHFGRFYRGIHWTVRQHVRDTAFDYDAFEADVCPPKYGRFFVYP